MKSNNNSNSDNEENSPQKNKDDSDEDDDKDEDLIQKSKKGKKENKKKEEDDDNSIQEKKSKIKKKENEESSSEEIEEKEILKKNIKIKYEIISKFENKISEILKKFKKEAKIPICFENILERLKRNLIDFNTSLSEGVFGDFTSVFKTGILTEKIFNQAPIITENLSNLPTAVLERCNDLFNYNPKISLSEDTCNTFTERDKELTGFADGFRVIATSSELGIKNLSDAAQSRFTIIYTTNYTLEERNLLIEIFYENPPQEFINFLQNYKKIFRKELPFLYITKILNIIKLIDSKMNKNEIDERRNLCLAIHLSLKFLMDNKNSRKLKTLVNNTILPDFYNLKEENKERKFEMEVEDKNPFQFLDNELHSDWSNLSIISSELEEYPDENLAFIKPFNKLLEHIFFSLAVNYPLIIEGETGKGKKSAIYYMAKILGYEVIYFNLSNNITVEDLFCKKMPVEENGSMVFIDIRSLLLDGIDANVKKDKNCIIILDNLQQANSNILESLIPIFDMNTKSILVQGEEIIKRKYNIIGIIDSSMGTKDLKDFLPDAIKYSTIIYRVSKYEKREYCRKIIEKMFGDEMNEDTSSQIEYYLNSYISLNNDVKKKHIKELFSFNDFKKFLYFLKKSRTDESDPSTNIFNIQTITQLLLVYKFKSKEEINSANKILGNSLESDFWPIFSYLSDDSYNDDDIEEDQFQIAPRDKDQNLSYPTKILIKKDKRKELLLKTHSLSPDQRRGIIFLMLSILSDIPCVIQGITSSGKTHLIRLFCELLGQKPLIIDINNDTGISILLKQLVPKEELEQEKISKIKKKIKKLIKSEKKINKNEIESIIDLNDNSNWLPSNFKNLIDYLEDKSVDIDDKNISLISELKSLLNEQLSFFKHLSNEDSAFIKAMRNGDWIILDGIESGQPELYQRISSLCDLENRNLTMYENGPEYVYTKNSKDEKFRIHPDFRLFITYNPFEAEPNKRLPLSFLNKCLTFSLSAIDEDIKTTSLVLAGIFRSEKLYKNLEKNFYLENKDELKLKYPDMKKKDIINDLWKEDIRILGIKYANIHHFSNEKARNNKEDFAGKKTFSGRSIKFILNSLKILPNEIEEGIIGVIQDIYCYPYKKSQNEFKNELINKFLKPPESKLIDFLRKDEVKVEEKYKTIMKDLLSIENNPKIDFDMNEFIKNTFDYIYEDIKHLIKEIEKCLSYLNIDNMNYTYLSIYRTILLNYIERKGNDEEIKKNLKSKKIDDLNLAKEDEYLRVPQNLLFIFKELVEKKMIKKIANVDYDLYVKHIHLNLGDEKEKSEGSDNKSEKNDSDKEESSEKSEIKNEGEEEEKENDDEEREGEGEEKENINEENKEEEEEDNEEKNKEEEDSKEDKSNEEEEDKDNPMKIISNSEKKYLKEKNINGENPFLELSLDSDNFIFNVLTLVLAFPELNDKSKEELESIFENLTIFKKEFFILVIKLFNNCEYNGEKEEILLCEKINKFIKEDDFLIAIENKYDKDELLNKIEPEKDKLKMQRCLEIKKELYNLSIADLGFCKREDDIVKDYLTKWYENYENYYKELDEAYYTKIGKEKEHKIKKKIDALIEKLKSKKSKIAYDYARGLLDDMIDYLNNLDIFNDEIYAVAESDVNYALRDIDSYIESSSRTTYIHFPIVEYDEDLKPKGDFQKIYSLLMNYSAAQNILKQFKEFKDERTFINLGKLKKYLEIDKDSSYEGLKLQYNILYSKMMSKSKEINYYINEFEDCILSNLLLKIYEINKLYLNKNTLINKLNDYCKRNVLKEKNIDFDLEWASYLSKTCEPFDEILLPNFTPESIIKLFTLKNEKGESDKGMLPMNIINKKKSQFCKEVSKLLYEENYTQTLSLTIQTIFEIAMLTIFTDEENIRNVDEIQKIFNEKFIFKFSRLKEEDIKEEVKEEDKKEVEEEEDKKEVKEEEIKEEVKKEEIKEEVKEEDKKEEVKGEEIKEEIKEKEIKEEIKEEEIKEEIKKEEKKSFMEDVDILEVIMEIKEAINYSKAHADLLEFISNLFKYLLCVEEKEKSVKEIIDLIPDFEEEEGFSEEISKSLIIPDFSITKIIPEKVKNIILDDIFFITNPNWKNDIISEYKKYPSLIFFLFKYPGCEKELREYLSKTDTIKKKKLINSLHFF